jgi:hypothetical protein
MVQRTVTILESSVPITLEFCDSCDLYHAAGDHKVIVDEFELDVPDIKEKDNGSAIIKSS